MKDPQRMYNYYSSAATETVALQSKTPYIAQAAAIEGYEDAWGMANRENMAYLPVNHLDDKGQPLQIPQRQPPPAMPDAMLKGMEYTQNELMMVSGQFQSQFGENENAKSGKAINARQRQGDNATYHFIDNQAIALRHLGRILINLIPAIYDTKRILRLRGKDGTKKSVMVDPQATQALQAVEDKANAEAEMIFNPAVGQYDVTADIGPSYATRRQEAWNAISQILAQNADLGHVVGDLLFKNADFPGAEEIAERIRRTIPPNILGDGPPPEMQKLQEQSAEQQKKMTGIIAELQAKIAEMTMRSQNKQNNDAVSVYDAESRRITALSNAKPELGLDTIKPMVERVLFEMASGGLANGNQPQSPQGGMSPQGAQMPMGGNGDQSDGDVAQGAGDPTQAPQDAPPPDMQQGMA